MTATMFQCAEEASEELSPEAKQRLALVYTGLAMPIQAMEFDDIQQLIERSEAYCDY